METLTESFSKQIVLSRQNKSVYSQEKKSEAGFLATKFSKLVKDLTPNYYSFIAMAILIGSCLGSIAAMSVFYNRAPIGFFCIGLFATMANLVTCIGQAPTKWVLNVFALSIVTNIVLILFFPV